MNWFQDGFTSIDWLDPFPKNLENFHVWFSCKKFSMDSFQGGLRTINWMDLFPKNLEIFPTWKLCKKFDQLISRKLYKNQLSGSIPKELGKLSNLAGL